NSRRMRLAPRCPLEPVISTMVGKKDTTVTSNLTLKQFAHRALRVDPCRADKAPEIQSAGKGIGKAEGQHRRDGAARIFQRPAGIGNSVLLCLAGGQM